MHDPLLRDEIEDFYQYLQKILCVDHLKPLSDDCDLVLDIVPVDNMIQWAYYYACHEKRCLFWLAPYDGTYMLSEVYGAKSPAHISALHLLSLSYLLSSSIRQAEHRLEASYWFIRCPLPDWYPKHQYCLARNHWSLFPAVFEGHHLQPSVYDELMGILSHGCV
jgi:hypothetical protein